jgi:hypothetical protein
MGSTLKCEPKICEPGDSGIYTNTLEYQLLLSLDCNFPIRTSPCANTGLIAKERHTALLFNLPHQKIHNLGLMRVYQSIWLEEGRVRAFGL